jgi:type II secretory pathway pseudopilin PulG
MNKKGSLNLSIQAIVVVVIAFVVLGLGLGFVRSQFASIESTSTSVQEQISQQILDDLRTGNKKLSFPASKLTLETSEESVQAIGIKNTGDSAISLLVGFEVKATGQQPFDSGVELEWTTTAGAVSGTILWDDSPQELKAGESRVVPVTIKAPDKIGNYLYKVILQDANEPAGAPFDQKTFFVKTT